MIRTIVILLALLAGSAHAQQVFQASAYGTFSGERVDHAPIIRRAIDAAQRAGGGVVKLPTGTTWVAVDEAGAAISVPAGVTLDMRGSTLRLIENDRPDYHVILFTGSGRPSGVIGGTIIGDKDQHLGTKGEWGMCISIRGASDVAIQGTKTLSCWGDGIYVGLSLDGSRKPSRGIVIEGVEAAHNRRNNISIIGVDGFRINNVHLHHARGIPPEAGLDLEPDNGGDVINGELTNIRAEQNGHAGVVFGGSAGKLDRVVMRDVVSTGNGGPGFWIQYVVNVRATGLRSEGNGQEGLRVIRSPNLSITDYRPAGNGKPDTGHPGR